MKGELTALLEPSPPLSEGSSDTPVSSSGGGETDVQVKNNVMVPIKKLSLSGISTIRQAAANEVWWANEKSGCVSGLR